MTGPRQDSENDEDDDESVLRSKGKRYITRAGAERLHGELLQLLHKERPKVTAEVSAAAAQGDRSENAEYIYGKKRLREIDRRIRFLQSRLNVCTVVTPSEQKDATRVFFGATVMVKDEAGERSTYQVVGPDEIDAAGGRISVDSPVGRSLLGKSLDDQVLLSRPKGDVIWQIVEIRYL